MNKTPHLRIRASAGTGKTFRLTDRIVELLLLGAEPGKIIALTFTRKAAGEFLVKTLRKLAELSSEDAAVEAFCARRQISRKLKTSDFLRLLRKLTDALDQIEFGTLDSFFYRVVAAFGAPLGLGTSPRLLDETSAGQAEEEILQHAADSLMEEAEALVADLIQTPKSAKLRPLEPDFAVLNRIESLYALHPEDRSWGEGKTLWGPDGCPWKSYQAPEDLSDCNENVRKAVSQLNDFKRNSDSLGTVAEQLLKSACSLREGHPTGITYRGKEISLSKEEQAVALNAVGACLWRNIAPRLAQARRWLKMAGALRSARDARIVNEGILRFADLPVLLSRITTSGIGPAEMQFRLDGWFDHWLLDEFQDTSRIQWRAIQPLLDEVLQDVSGTRSFFYVGDVKQSIYGFRDGDPTLFGEIFKHYTRHAPDHITDEFLGESRRSAKEIIELIDRTFAPEKLRSVGMPQRVVEAWEQAWTDHTAHNDNPSPGFVRSISCDPREYWEQIAGIVRESGVLERRDLTVAVLVKTNNEAREAVGEFGRLGIPATSESNPHIAADNPQGVAILMASRLVADPSDAFARLAVRQYAAISESAASGRALELFHLHGAEDMVQSWLEELPITPRHTALRRAAREFDENMRGSPREFARFLADYADPTSARAGTVQVMTIHKAKGLEFDLVFLPLPKDVRLDGLRSDSPYCSPGTPAWILQLPSEKLRAADPVLRSAGEQLREAAAFDNLCGYYVAETRARRAFVLLSQSPRPPSPSKKPSEKSSKK